MAQLDLGLQWWRQDFEEWGRGQQGAQNGWVKACNYTMCTGGGCAQFASTVDITGWDDSQF